MRENKEKTTNNVGTKTINYKEEERHQWTKDRKETLAAT